MFSIFKHFKHKFSALLNPIIQMKKINENHNIAIIDDGKDFFFKINTLFKDKNYTIEWINSADEAQELLMSDKHCLYLINYTFHEYSGINLLKNAKKNGSLSHIIVYNSEEEKDVSIEALDAGASDYIIMEQTENTLLKQKIIHHLNENEVFQELFDREAKYRNLMDSLPVMFYTAEPNPPFKPIFMSKGFESLGYPLEDWFNKPGLWFEMLHPEDNERILQSSERARLNNDRTDQEYRVILKDGSIRWLHDRGELIKDQSGKALYWQGLLIDVTEKKEAENALKESEMRYRDLFENANDLLYVHDLEGNFLSVNITAEEIFGYNRKEALKMNLKDILVPKYLEIAQKRIAEKIGGKENSVYEVECITKNGSRRTLEINSRILYQGKMPVAVQGIARDITDKKHAEQRLIESEERFRDLFENANDLIYTHDLEGNFTSLNLTGEKIIGYTRVEAAKLSIKDIVAPECLKKANEMIARKIAGEPPTTYELDIYTKDNKRLTLEVSSRLTIENGKPVGVQGIARDVTEKNRLINERDRFYKLSLDLLGTVDFGGSFMQVNPSWEKSLGYEESELIGRSIYEFIHPDDIEEAKKFDQKVREGKTVSFEIRMLCKDGSVRWIYWGIIPIYIDKICYAVGRDITDRKQSEQKMEFNAMHDTLTSLPNRTHFIKHLELAIERTKIEERFRFAVLFLDLDRFKVVNDSLGHIVGDKLLIAIADRLRTCVRPSDVIARLGGDEFTILAAIKDEADAIRVAERLQEQLTENFKIENYEVFSSASIGIIISDETDRKPEDFLRDADTAMYRAKESGKARYEIFDREMHVYNMRLLQVETDLRRAMEREEFKVVYQPIVDLQTGKIQEFEALLRWQHPKHGLVLPNEFISIAEETGLIIPMGQWILKEACRQTYIWQEEFSIPLSISVNLSTKQLMNPNLTTEVQKILDETKLNPAKLSLEVTESSVMDFSDTALDVLSELRAMGISLSTDDFGTGYSSLSYLHKYPFQRIKIDRSFTGKMDDEKSLAIIRTILILGQNLNIEVVAEGVESEYQLNELTRLGCKAGQGYLFSEPVGEKTARSLILENMKKFQPYKIIESNNNEIVEIEKIQ